VLTPSAFDIWQIILEWAPIELAESWDNCGLQVGDPGDKVRGILLALDPSEDLLQDAVQKGANMVITHHPLIFKPILSLDISYSKTRLLAGFLHSGINLYAAHTNLDSAAGGVSDVLMKKLGILNAQPLVSNTKAGTGLGRIGLLQKAITMKEMVQRILDATSAPGIWAAGRPEMLVQKVALCSGSGSDLWPVAVQHDADIFISAEIKHHIAREAQAMGKAVVDAGHFFTEHPVIEEMGNVLKKAVQERAWDIAIHIHRESPPVELYTRSLYQGKEPSA
jgi:dinuclear metal center YbgI/SA1388 family protein